MLAERNQSPRPETLSAQTLWARFEQTPDYFLGVRGDSMDRVGIKDRDVVAVRTDPDVREGDIVIARIGTEITMKRYHRERTTGQIELQTESTNPEHEAIRLTEDTDCEIVGVVVGAIIGTPRGEEESQ